jgi:hypothetical protein
VVRQAAGRLEEAADREIGGPVGIGEQPPMTDPMEAIQPRVLKEEADNASDASVINFVLQ